MGVRANELRIGNWVRWNYEESSEGNVYPVEYGYELDDIKNNPNIVKPIPLSEEWLLKFGFEKDDGIWEHEELMWSCEISGDDDSFNFKRLGLDLPCIGIFYVHQLQNLYFAITGEELTIKTIDQWENMK